MRGENRGKPVDLDVAEALLLYEASTDGPEAAHFVPDADEPMLIW
jgi:hypothetical protein